MNKLKKEYKLTLIGGIVIILLGVLIQAFRLDNGLFSLTLINAGAVMVVIAFISHIRYGNKVVKDERTKKIGALALSYSWFISFILINILYWIDYLKIFSFSADQVLGILMFTMIFTAGIIQMYYKRKGLVNED